MPLGKLVWNKQCKERFWLHPDAEVDIALFYSTLHEEDRERTRVAIDRALLYGEPYDIEYRPVAPDGRVRWVRAKGRAYYMSRIISGRIRLDVQRVSIADVVTAAIQ